jgi:hypothetical protein
MRIFALKESATPDWGLCPAPLERRLALLRKGYAFLRTINHHPTGLISKPNAKNAVFDN